VLRVREDKVLGVVGTVVRDDRAVSGVGALICDFFGVSPPFCLLDDGKDRGLEMEGLGLVSRGRRPEVMNSWRNAACGFIRRSGSQTRHLAMKSTKA